MKQTNLLLTLLFCSTLLFGQHIIKVKEGDTSKMEKDLSSEWLFKDNLPDGHYMSYRNNDTLNTDKEIMIKNGKKNGLESRYYSNGTKYLDINWKDDKREGLTTHYGGNLDIRCITSQATFTNDILNGPIFINYGECSKKQSGYFKNGIKDSIWTYYEPYSEMRIDSANYFLAKTYRYVNGLPSLVSAWNKKGEMTVYEGNGVIIDSSSLYPVTTPYKNGLRNGFETSIKPNGDTAFIKKYDNDILIYEKLFVDIDINPEDSSTYAKTLENYNREVIYPALSYLHTISAWKVSDQLLIDTTEEIIDFSNPVTYSKEIRVVNNSLKNGYWAVYFENGIAAVEGNYLNGKQIGEWTWKYPNGKNRLIVNYDNNIWKHLDSTGKVVSNFNNEYITKITAGLWVLDDVLSNELKKKKITLTTESNNQRQYDYEAIEFLLDGEVKTYHSGDYQSSYIGNYALLGEYITLSIKDWKSNTFKRYTYKISFDKKGNMILEK